MPDSFWVACFSQFTDDGTKAVFYSPKSCYKIDLTPLEKKYMAQKRIEKLSALSNKEVQIFNFQTDDFTFVS